MEYELLYYIILWAANKISEEALLFYNSYLPSLEIIEKFITTNVKEWDINFLSNTEESHAKYRSTMLLMTSSLLNYVDLEQIHPSIISDIIEPLDGIVDSNILLNKYRKKALLAEKYSNIMYFSGMVEHVVLKCALIITVLILPSRVPHHMNGLELHYQ
ncbi:4378_t:CDS:1 [Funneliformis geosporum]|uniref:4378_t:CDS:1 n=1 Tax=Funneliformis geosporum TaxID=1117311 RepID=A0A9W4WRQ1_9GLOM|nr:4378_t:CDS:1 [Funneliformis geosporum]